MVSRVNDFAGFDRQLIDAVTNIQATVQKKLFLMVTTTVDITETKSGVYNHHVEQIICE